MDKKETLIRILTRIRRIIKFATILEFIFIQVIGWMYFYSTSREFIATRAEYLSFLVNLICVGLILSVLIFLIKWVFKKKLLKRALMTVMLGQLMSFGLLGILAAMDEYSLSCFIVFSLAVIYCVLELAIRLLVNKPSAQEIEALVYENACEEKVK